MSYIYSITNQINGKQYIGATTLSLEERYQHHIYDSRKDRCSKRPLYKAMNKYGEHNFSIDVVEEVEDEKRFEREVYWIEKLGTFMNGYNGTLGGEGTPYVDHVLVVATYNKTLNIKETSKLLEIDEGTAAKILKENNVDILSQHEVLLNTHRKMIGKLDLDGNLLEVYSSLSDAQDKNKKAFKQHIGKVCQGKRKTHAGYRWEYL